MMVIFLLKLPQFEKTGSLGKIFYFAGKYDNSFPFSKLEGDHIFCALYSFAVR